MTMRRIALPVAAALLALAGCQTAQEQMGACPTPPPPNAEQRPLPPVANYEQTWQPGHWDWNGSGYSWRPGAWIPRNQHTIEWMDGYWTRNTTPGPCNWLPAHWL
jgi:hypothetical protein